MGDVERVRPRIEQHLLHGRDDRERATPGDRGRRLERLLRPPATLRLERREEDRADERGRDRAAQREPGHEPAAAAPGPHALAVDERGDGGVHFC